MIKLTSHAKAVENRDSTHLTLAYTEAGPAVTCVRQSRLNTNARYIYSGDICPCAALYSKRDDTVGETITPLGHAHSGAFISSECSTERIQSGRLLRCARIKVKRFLRALLGVGPLSLSSGMASISSRCSALWRINEGGFNQILCVEIDVGLRSHSLIRACTRSK